MGLLNRISTVIKQKANYLVDKYEDPRQALDYSYEKQRELVNRLRRDMAEVVTSKKRLEMQKARLWDNIRTLDEQARRSLDSDREDLAKLALQRKNANLIQMQGLDRQIAEMQAEQEKLEQTEKRLSAKVEEFKSKKEVIKAQYSSAEAQVRIKENITGISEEMTDVGIAMNRVEEKAERMKSKAQALDEMISSGVLVDYTSNKDEIENELEQITVNKSVEEELAKLKAEKLRKKKRVIEQEQEVS
ncbi:MAG: PspA/IM30 family protein [Nitrososphaeraceae archaeon]|nr:PspA/IM30 family protein [Nitrososphaeraceae archaeon]